MVAAVSMENVSKTYGDGTQALKGLSLEIPQGQIYGLLGPNGAGKSTSIGIIDGMIPKSGGTVKLFGLDNTIHTQQTKLMLGVVTQEIVSEPIFTVYEVLDFFAGMYGVKKNDRRVRINEILEALHLSDKKDTKARFLSGGMKRRLMVAKALIHQPKVVILDEPTAGVDVELRKNIWEYVRKLNNEGVTIIFTTHYLEEAEKLCERIAIINKGELIVEENTEKLKTIFGKCTVNAKLESANFDLPKKEHDDIIEIKDNHVKIVTCSGNESYYVQQLATKAGLQEINIGHPTLEDIFVELVRAK